jgi:hypothetical protein
MLGNVSPSGIVSGATTGAEIGLVAGPIGAGIGAAAGAIANLITGLWTNVNNQTATTCANNAEYAGVANLTEWNNYPAYMKTKTLQIQYLNQAEQIWSYLQSCCGQPQLKSAGSRCVSERARGGKYDFLSGYYDPIANDPAVANNSTPVQLVAPLQQDGTVPMTSVINPVTGTTSLLTIVEQNPMLDLALLAAVGLLLL